MREIGGRGLLTTFIEGRYRDFFLKPALNCLKKQQAKAKVKFWTMPFDAICVAQILHGFYEKNLLSGICELTKDKDGVALDIGANIGNHTLYLAQEFDYVVAFEPVPRNCWILKANLHLNNIDNVALIERGLSNKNSKMVVNNPDPENTNTPLGEINSDAIGQTIVEVVVGDEQIEQLGLKNKIRVIKVDVEGHEPEVFDGLRRTIEKHRPIIFWEAFNMVEANKTREILEAIGYENFYHLTPSRFKSRTLNKIWSSVGRGALLVPMDNCHLFDGLNVASIQKL